MLSSFTNYISSFQTSIGMGRVQAQLMSGYLSIWFLFTSSLTWFLIERVGRQPLLLIFHVAMACVMAIIVAMAQVVTYASGLVAAAAIFLYGRFFAWAWMGNLWCYTAERKMYIGKTPDISYISSSLCCPSQS